MATLWITAVVHADAPEGARTATNWTTIVAHANAPRHALTATNWTTIVAHANATRHARTATNWTTVAASVSPGHAGACASPAPNRNTTPTNGCISVQLITTITHAESTAIATGTAIGMA